MDTSRDVTVSHFYVRIFFVVVVLKCGMNGQAEKDYDSSKQNYMKISLWHRSADRFVYLKRSFVIVLRVRHVNYIGLLNIRIESGKITNARIHLSSNWRGNTPDYFKQCQLYVLVLNRAIVFGAYLSLNLLIGLHGNYKWWLWCHFEG